MHNNVSGNTNLETQLKKGSLELCILALLEKRQLYGYDLILRLTESGILVTEGTLYPILLRLKNEGHLTSHWVESEQGRQRKYYEITEMGKNSLLQYKKQWLDYINVVNALIQ